MLLSDSLAQPIALQSGSALANPQLPHIAAANRIMDAAIPLGSSAEQTIAEVHAHFAAIGMGCLEWWLNPSQPTGPLPAALLAAGYAARALQVLALSSPARPPDRLDIKISVFSARAALAHAAALAGEMTASLPHPAEQAEAFLQRLDDPHYELLLAMQSGVPVGMIGLLAGGDLGRIDPLFIHPGYRDSGLERMLIERALELSARSRFADILVGPPAQPAFFLAAGFRPAGCLTIYKLPER
jgi:GNAT superfamily N-acetyltransferase